MSRSEYDAILPAPFGALGIVAHEALTSIDFLPAAVGRMAPRTPLAREVCDQLRSYFRHPRYSFDLPVRLSGSDFQRRAWRALRRIPSGSVVTYGQLAAKLGSGARAVGGACRANPIPLVVPCHRVIGASGFGGFMGGQKPAPMAIKRWLLEHERGG